MQNDNIKSLNECDCDEDNKCGCSYPNNIDKSACNCDENTNICDCASFDNDKNIIATTESICYCDPKGDCSCNKNK